MGSANEQHLNCSQYTCILWWLQTIAVTSRGHQCISNHWYIDCLFNSLFKLTIMWNAFPCYTDFWYISIWASQNFQYHVTHYYSAFCWNARLLGYPDSKIHGANIWPTWVLSAPDGPHVGPMNLAFRVMLHMLYLSNYHAASGIML